MFNYKPLLQTLQTNNQFKIDVLRLDLLDPIIGGNKWFKLKNNLTKAIQQKNNTILTFGGAHSNHIAATAKACKQFNLKSIGIVRGHEMKSLSSTLLTAQQNGMDIHFVSRDEYTKKNETSFVENLKKKFGDFYLIPEGGDNAEGILGCMQILNSDWEYDYIFCACGTGTTFAGIAASVNVNQTVIGISVLKGENLMPMQVMEKLKTLFPSKSISILGNEALNQINISNHAIINSYAFSGYAKCDKSLVEFKNQFETQNKIELDYIYTNKLFYAIQDLISLNKLKSGSRILAIHSGGLQGNAAFEERYFKSV